MDSEVTPNLERALWAAVEAAEDALAVADSKEVAVIRVVLPRLRGIRKFYIDMR